MPVGWGMPHDEDAGPMRFFFVAAPEADAATLTAIGKARDPAGAIGYSVDRGALPTGETGFLLGGWDPTVGSKSDRDILLRLAKAGFAARELTEDEFYAAVGQDGPAPSSTAASTDGA